VRKTRDPYRTFMSLLDLTRMGISTAILRNPQILSI
jgi:hypothetical protein